MQAIMAPYWLPLLGGVLIGLAAAILLFSIGRIAGISTIFWRSVSSRQSIKFDEGTWRPAFILGLVVGPVIAHQFLGFETPQAPEGTAFYAVVAGFLVGFGTKLGSGCTSGHGICGLPRLSRRSLVATMTFMLTGILTVTLIRHVL